MKISEIQSRLSLTYNEAKKFKEQAELLATPIVKGCKSCVHNAVSLFVEPCYSCHLGKNFVNWELVNGK